VEVGAEGKWVRKGVRVRKGNWVRKWNWVRKRMRVPHSRRVSVFAARVG